jgi:hypothetical protein
MPPISTIAVINASNILSNTDGQYMVDALNKILPQFCSDWSIPTCTAVYIKKGATTTIKTKVFFLNSTDYQGALAYHHVSDGIPYGRVFVDTVLRYGPILWSPDSTKPTVAQCLAHEVFELLINPFCNSWWMLPDDYTLYPSEVSDPVQGNIVLVTLSYTTRSSSIPIRQITTTVKVGMSDWVLPSWTNFQGSRPFNRNNTLTAPFQIAPGGYEYVLRGGEVTTIFGMRASQYFKEKVKNSPRFAKTTPTT